MSRMRILVAAPSMAIVGGQSVQAARLISAFGQRPELEVSLVPTNPSLPPPASLLQKFKYLRTLVTEAAYLARILFSTPRHHVIHVFTAGYSSFLLTYIPVILAKSLFGIRVLLNYHDGRAEHHFKNSPLSRYLVRTADRIVVPSCYLVTVFKSFGLEAVAIPNILDRSRFSFRLRPNPRPRFLHNRGLERHYNVPCTLRAFALVQQKYPAASLVVAHDGPERAQVEQLARTLQLKNVRFTGSVDQQTMAGLYNQADIYLMSPDADNMPLSILECYASGLPLVSTAVGGVPLMVEDGVTGLLVPPNDHEAMAKAAIRLIEEPELATRIGRAGYEKLRYYAPDRIADQWKTLYRELLSTR